MRILRAAAAPTKPGCCPRWGPSLQQPLAPSIVLGCWGAGAPTNCPGVHQGRTINILAPWHLSGPPDPQVSAQQVHATCRFIDGGPSYPPSRVNAHRYCHGGSQRSDPAHCRAHGARRCSAQVSTCVCIYVQLYSWRTRTCRCASVCARRQAQPCCGAVWCGVVWCGAVRRGEARTGEVR